MDSSKPSVAPIRPLIETLKRRLTRVFWFALALVFLFESWLWDNVKEWLRALERKLGLDRLEVWLEQLSRACRRL